MTANQETQLRTDLSPLNGEELLKAKGILESAADTFVKHVHDTVEIWAASRDWFLEEWGRDTFIALPGCLLVTQRYDEAKQVFSHFADFEEGGLIPNRITEEEILYNTVDGSLWYIHALEQYLHCTDDWDFVFTVMPTVRNIMSGYRKGTTYKRTGSTYSIVMDPGDGLIISPSQATWMDADPSGAGSEIVTPRNGKAVEINALWYVSLYIVADWEERCGDAKTAKAYRQLASKVQNSFQHKFWNTDEKCLFDVVEGDSHGGAVRPNQLIAISRGRDLLTQDQQVRILELVTNDLLTPAGMRTLSPRDSYYKGIYDTSAPMSEKDYAYHQGTVWPWLIGPYIDALVIVRAVQNTDTQDLKNEILQILSPLIRFCMESKHRNLPEVFSGDPPHEPGGTTAQAWSVAEVLRVVEEYL